LVQQRPALRPAEAVGDLAVGVLYEATAKPDQAAPRRKELEATKAAAPSPEKKP
jgi:hypothetical protein